MEPLVTKRIGFSMKSIETGSEIENLEVKQDTTFSHPSFKKIPSYLASRFTTLCPSRKDFMDINLTEMLNPFHSLGELNGRQWNFFLVGGPRSVRLLLHQFECFKIGRGFGQVNSRYNLGNHFGFNVEICGSNYLRYLG